MYARALEGQVYVVDCNLGAKPCMAFRLKERCKIVYDTVRTGKEERSNSGAWNTVISRTLRKGGMLQGYEARILKIL